MRRGDFGTREVFFLLLLSSIAIGLAWFGAYAFAGIVQAIAGVELLIGFFIFSIFGG